MPDSHHDLQFASAQGRPRRRHTVNRLRPLWKEALCDAAEDPRADSVLAWLVAQYTRPLRAYHNLAHIERMFAAWNELASRVTTTNPQALALAIWFHDAIYDPTRRDNEERSAQEADRRLRPFGITEESLTQIGNMIAATALHETNSTGADTSLLLDLDLAILGAEQTEYQAYARAIRQEYRHVPEKDFRIGRIAALRRILDRPRIYSLDPTYQLYEGKARHNIALEIEALAGAP